MQNVAPAHQEEIRREALRLLQAESGFPQVDIRLESQRPTRRR